MTSRPPVLFLEGTRRAHRVNQIEGGVHPRQRRAERRGIENIATANAMARFQQDLPQLPSYATGGACDQNQWFHLFRILASAASALSRASLWSTIGSGYSSPAPNSGIQRRQYSP